ncbi:hypothetical protein PR048_003399 [Dryococelus australis]|uniref:Uncharacterized protein n=1 Tax=Dryococelus australis TaxID=614101 RepID=A0ABQ9IN03_9NEOP|nr:hypothetical protein PR048_003399 [Dryococelus australis]
MPMSTVLWLSAVTVEGDDWASLLHEVSNTMWTNGYSPVLVVRRVLAGGQAPTCRPRALISPAHHDLASDPLHVHTIKALATHIFSICFKPCLTMPLVGGFSRGSPVSPALSFRRCRILTSITVVGSQELEPLGTCTGEKRRSGFFDVGLAVLQLAERGSGAHLRGRTVVSRVVNYRRISLQCRVTEVCHHASPGGTYRAREAVQPSRATNPGDLAAARVSLFKPERPSPGALTRLYQNKHAVPFPSSDPNLSLFLPDYTSTLQSRSSPPWSAHTSCAVTTRETEPASRRRKASGLVSKASVHEVNQVLERYIRKTHRHRVFRIIGHLFLDLVYSCEGNRLEMRAEIVVHTPTRPALQSSLLRCPSPPPAITRCQPPRRPITIFLSFTTLTRETAPCAANSSCTRQQNGVVASRHVATRSANQRLITYSPTWPIGNLLQQAVANQTQGPFTKSRSANQRTEQNTLGCVVFVRVMFNINSREYDNLVTMMLQGRHRSGKQGNAREFENCQGNQGALELRLEAAHVVAAVSLDTRGTCNVCGRAYTYCAHSRLDFAFYCVCERAVNFKLSRRDDNTPPPPIPPRTNMARTGSPRDIAIVNHFSLFLFSRANSSISACTCKRQAQPVVTYLCPRSSYQHADSCRLVPLNNPNFACPCGYALIRTAVCGLVGVAETVANCVYGSRIATGGAAAVLAGSKGYSETALTRGGEAARFVSGLSSSRAVRWSVNNPWRLQPQALPAGSRVVNNRRLTCFAFYTLAPRSSQPRARGPSCYTLFTIKHMAVLIVHLEEESTKVDLPQGFQKCSVYREQPFSVHGSIVCTQFSPLRQDRLAAFKQRTEHGLSELGRQEYQRLRATRRFLKEQGNLIFPPVWTEGKGAKGGAGREKYEGGINFSQTFISGEARVPSALTSLFARLGALGSRVARPSRCDAGPSTSSLSIARSSPWTGKCVRETAGCCTLQRGGCVEWRYSSCDVCSKSTVALSPVAIVPQGRALDLARFGDFADTSAVPSPCHRRCGMYIPSPHTGADAYFHCKKTLFSFIHVCVFYCRQGFEKCSMNRKQPVHILTRREGQTCYSFAPKSRREYNIADHQVGDT